MSQIVQVLQDTERSRNIVQLIAPAGGWRPQDDDITRASQPWDQLDPAVAREEGRDVHVRARISWLLHTAKAGQLLSDLLRITLALPVLQILLVSAEAVWHVAREGAHRGCCGHRGTQVLLLL
eukprot:COSAG05_NODE_2914_length_2512_cov_10.137588_3_plen_123_part_00